MIKLTLSLWMGAKVVNGSVVCSRLFFFLKHINDVMISHFAADNGRQMCVNALSSQRGAEGC